MAELRWNQQRVMLAITRRQLQRAQRAATMVEQQIQARLGSPYPPASRPGQPPHRRRGVLQRSIRASARSLALVVRVQVLALAPYASFLQRGTRRMARRPFFGLPADARLIVDVLSGRR